MVLRQIRESLPPLHASSVNQYKMQNQIRTRKWKQRFLIGEHSFLPLSIKIFIYEKGIFFTFIMGNLKYTQK